MRKNLLRAMCIALLGAVLLTACSKENKLEQPPAETPSGGTERKKILPVRITLGK